VRTQPLAAAFIAMIVSNKMFGILPNTAVNFLVISTILSG
jgi:hypothetical protein